MPAKKSVTIDTSESLKGNRLKRNGAIRDQLAFCILGFNNKFGFVLMLSAAHDISHNFLPELKLAEPSRHCHEISTGIILIVNELPAYLMLFLMPKFPNWFVCHVTVSCFLSVTSFFLVALSQNIFLTIFGVILTSLAFGIGDWSLRRHCNLYTEKTVEKLVLGTNAAGTWSSLLYATFYELGMNKKYIFFSMLIFPLLAMISCWCLLRSQNDSSTNLGDSNENNEFPLSLFYVKSSLELINDKCDFITHLMKYVCPLGFVVLMQYFINQGLYEFIYFRHNFINLGSQYRWYNCVYQIGVYACLTTKNLLVLNHIWIYAILQFLLLTIFLLDAIFMFMPYLWCPILLTYFEGILSGGALSNTLQKIVTDEPLSRLEIAENVLKHCLYIISILSGSFAVVVHYFLCRMPEPSRP